MNPAILLLVLAIVACSADACLHNATHCQCTTVPAGGNCMKHISGSGSSAVCDIYPCGEGVVCDCLGDQLCEISSCVSENIYRPLSPVQSSQTGSVACELAPRGEGTCVNAIGPLPPSPSATPLPIASVGESCSLPSLTCAPGLTCLCGNGRCVQDRVSLDIRAIGDDSITIYSCDGGEIGAIPNVFTTGSMRYEGMCQDLIVVVRNVGGAMALSLAVTYEGVTYVSGRDLPMVVAGGPVDGYLQCCNYDYSSFGASVQAGDASRGVYVDFGNANNGAEAQSISGPGLANTDYVFRVTLPFCSQPNVVSPTPSPLPSTTPTPTVSPSSSTLPVASAGESCSLPSLTCAPGLTCLCGNGRCVQDRVSLDIRAIGDDSITIYSCDGGEIGAIPNVFTTGSMRYEGMCQDLIVVVRNVGGAMALSLAVTYEGVTYVSGRDLPMVVAGGPVDGYLQCCNYDYSSFGASVQAGDASRGVYVDFGNANNGAEAQSISGPGLANTDYVFRVTLPFCSQSDVVLPTPSPLPSFVAAPTASPLASAGESCASLECAAGLTCRCDDDVCVPTVEFDIHAIGDDVVTIYTCSGGEIGNIPLVHRIDTFRHVGMCEDLIVVVRNNLLEVGLAIAVTYEGVVYATGNNLPVSVAQNPPNGFLNCCNYDFTPFQEPRLLTEHIGVSVFTGYINFANAYNGGRPVTFPSSTFLSNTDYVFRVSLPFCPPSLAAAPAAV